MMETLIQEWQWHHVPITRISIPLKLNAYRKINKLLEAINEKIPAGTIITGWAETQEGRKKRIMKGFFFPANVIIYIIDFMFHRVLPKLNRFTSSVYFFITGGKNRVLSKAEILGRIYSCGYKIEQYYEEGNILRFAAKNIYACFLQEGLMVAGFPDAAGRKKWKINLCVQTAHHASLLRIPAAIYHGA